MKCSIFIIFCLVVPKTFSAASEKTAAEEFIGLMREIATSDIAEESGKNLVKILKTAPFILKRMGTRGKIAGELLSFALSNLEEKKDQVEDYLKNITEKHDKIVLKLDNISGQIMSLDSKMMQSTKKILAELKFREFLKYFEKMAASREHFESIISSFSSNPDSLVAQLDKFIEDYRQKGYDTKLINTLDSGSGITNSIVDDLISVSRSYHDNNFSSSRSSTMKTIYEVYITALMTVIKANVILDCAVNLKTAITGKYFEEDRQYNHYRRNKIMKTFFSSLQKTFAKLEDDDVEAFIDFSVTGDKETVRLINVLQIFWENEDTLSKASGDDICSDDCENIQDREFNGQGCNGSVKNCQLGVTLERKENYLRQSPQVDRIYEGYSFSKQWYGRGSNDTQNPAMESKKSYIGMFVICHICKCICDQYSNDNTVRKFYSGKIVAPDGYVVTGIRIVEKNKAIYPQIQVGKLLPLTTVEESSVIWLEIPNDDNFTSFDFHKHTIIFGSPSSMKFSDGVVTGVQFKEMYRRISWSIYGRQLLDFNRGLLGNESCIETDETDNYIDFYNTNPGLAFNKDNYIISKNIKAIFGTSNEESDAGQSFVPYFDGNEIVFDIKSPLSGIALIHYTNDENFAGYIRPLIQSLDYRKLFSTTFEVSELMLSEVMNEKSNMENSSNSLHSRLLLLICAVVLKLFVKSINIKLTIC